MTPLRTCMNRIASPSDYAREQWFALGLCLVCYTVTFWAAYYTWSQPYPVSDAHHFLEGMVELALGVAATTLLYFAFSHAPERVATL